MARFLLMSIFVAGALFSILPLGGCFYPASIDEEDPVPDDPPYFERSSLTPNPFTSVPIDLAAPSFPTFSIGQIEDINESQTLYGRVMIDLGNRIHVPRSNDAIPPEQARKYNYILAPCEQPLLQLFLADREVQVYRLYIAISDARFLGVRDNASLEELLITDTDVPRAVALAQWELRLGAVPTTPCTL